jgi:hypothetical protein
MKRMHVHVSVEKLTDNVRFYSALFGAEPTVIKPDYAKWMLDDPPVNFAISRRGAAVGLNHLGIQVESAGELAEMQTRVRALPAGFSEEAGATCCYARSDKYWAVDPQGISWETFQTLHAVPAFGGDETKETACCIPLSRNGASGDTPCCVPGGSAVTALGACC